jgi:hypothetical protein
MIENIVIRKQVASEGHKLFQRNERGFYTINDSVYLGKDATEWDECTLEQAAEYEKINEQIRQEIEDTQADVVE